MNELLWQVVNAALVAAVAVLAGYVVYEVKAWRAKNPEAFDQVHDIVDTCVKAAEQLGLKELIEDKYEYAMHMAQVWLEQEGIALDIEALAAAIENAVWENFNSPWARKVGG